MKCTVLGCGTSTGVPLPGCRCAVCTSGSPKNFRDRTSAVITTDSGKNILIDASTDLRHQALKHDLRAVHAVLITHGHADHIAGLDDLRSFNFVMKSRIPIYATRSTLEELREKYRYVFEPRPNYEGGMLPQLELHEVHYGVPIEICGVSIIPCKVLHGSLEVTAFRIGDLGYATDCKVLPLETREILRNCSVLLLDAIEYYSHRTHLTIDEAIEVSKDLQARQTYFIHMTHTVDYDTVNPMLPPGIELAYDGLVFDF